MAKATSNENVTWQDPELPAVGIRSATTVYPRLPVVPEVPDFNMDNDTYAENPIGSPQDDGLFDIHSTVGIPIAIAFIVAFSVILIVLYTKARRRQLAARRGVPSLNTVSGGVAPCKHFCFHFCIFSELCYFPYIV